MCIFGHFWWFWGAFIRCLVDIPVTVTLSWKKIRPQLFFNFGSWWVLSELRICIFDHFWVKQQKQIIAKFRNFSGWTPTGSRMKSTAFCLSYLLLPGSPSTWKIHFNHKRTRCSLHNRACRREEIFPKSLAWLFFWCLFMYRSRVAEVEEPLNRRWTKG